MAGKHHVTTEQANRIDGMLNWWDRVGKHLQMPQQAFRKEMLPTASDHRFRAYLKGAMSSTDATHTVDTVVKITGRSPTTSSTAEVTVNNVHAWDADDNALCRVEWVAGSSQWEFYQVNCPAT